MIKDGDVVEIIGWRGLWRAAEITDDIEPYLSFVEILDPLRQIVGERFVRPVVIFPEVKTVRLAGQKVS